MAANPVDISTLVCSGLVLFIIIILIFYALYQRSKFRQLLAKFDWEKLSVSEAPYKVKPSFGTNPSGPLVIA